MVSFISALWLAFFRVRFMPLILSLVSIMSIQGYANLHNQWSIIGEFNNLPQEELIQWIKYSTQIGVCSCFDYMYS